MQREGSYAGTALANNALKTLRHLQRAATACAALYSSSAARTRRLHPRVRSCVPLGGQAMRLSSHAMHSRYGNLMAWLLKRKTKEAARWCTALLCDSSNAPIHMVNLYRCAPQPGALAPGMLSKNGSQAPMARAP